MASMRPHEEAMDVTAEISPALCDPCTEDCADTERESVSRPTVNVSRDTCLVLAGAEPQACHPSSPSKFLADVISSQEYSQAPTSSAQVAPSQQPSPELLISLGVKVRDFAYENTLPAIVPVPRVPRQVQPAPRALKRSQRDWDDKEGSLNGLSLAQPHPEQTGSKKPRSLERKPTEPLQEPAVQHTRTLERLMFNRVLSIFTPLPRRSLPTTPRTQFSADPPTSPLTLPLSHLASEESESVQTPPPFPFVVQVDDTSMIPASQHDTESQLPSLHPVLYTRFALDSHSSPGSSPAASPPPHASPGPLITPFLELPSPMMDSGADSRVRKRRGRGAIGTTPSSRYQLRQRPIPSSLTSTLSRCSHQAGSTPKLLPRRTRRLQ